MVISEYNIFLSFDVVSRVSKQNLLHPTNQKQNNQTLIYLKEAYNRGGDIRSYNETNRRGLFLVKKLKLFSRERECVW